MHYIKTATAQLAKASEAAALAKEIALYTTIKFPQVTIQVETERLTDRLDVHFAVDVEDMAVLMQLREQSVVDGLLQMLAGQFARLFVNGRLQDVYGGDCGVTVVA